MSYILEALKKAQAERQLGDAPTLHSPPPVAALQPAPGASRKPLLVGLGVGALAVAAGALMLWRQAPSPAPVLPAAVAPAALPAAQAAPAQAPAKAVAAASAPLDTLEVSAPPPPRAESRAAEPRPAEPKPAKAQSSAPVRQNAASPATVAAAPEDSLPFLQQLPDAIQREVPRVTFGGYMYSANPADRLLLVDKSLRHEGEEVAPGLVLEKLLPKAAVMNYRGYRYRVAY